MDFVTEVAGHTSRVEISSRISMTSRAAARLSTTSGILTLFVVLYKLRFGKLDA